MNAEYLLVFLFIVSSFAVPRIAQQKVLRAPHLFFRRFPRQAELMEPLGQAHRAHDAHQAG
ncbi:MAG TPA: hypothetical protein VMB04_24130 [Mycobacterium sp.]|nr:hypothetical protein [Mycobacterium sp.]